jgi:hypothetical protein
MMKSKHPLSFTGETPKETAQRIGYYRYGKADPMRKLERKRGERIGQAAKAEIREWREVK